MTRPDPSSKAQIGRVPADADPNVVCQVLEDDGAVILEGVFSDDTISRFNRELDPAAKAAEMTAKTNQELQFHLQSNYVFNLPGISNTFRNDILNSPVLHGLAKKIFQETGDYWLTAAFLRELHPGTTAQNLHRDEGSHPLLSHQKPGAPPITTSFILALTDFKRDNGGTRVILGSHKWPEIGDLTDAQTVSTEMKAGDVLVLAQGVIHAGGAHPVDVPDPRRAVLVFFSSCQITPFETYMAMPRAVVETMTPLAQKMVGWRSVKPGHSNESRLHASGSKLLEEAKQVIHPNVTGLHNAGSKLLEDALQLKANQPLGNGM
ncbi:hypothetical protein PENARI_c010G00061 [Penicillium arizonense]|jgi:verruculogen synthase|uniref:Fe2OG dioxygenase domain-containing protein n=1 Tax=Penicillium arizonense TaxID=1835702 RepID=A0A1F5LGR8_PENAI|nr:hypothetical protein PENARI_c010G00061 [Penicillium arizonense]OGE52414.1 hypothetical protein PENARI_c010G00061 [Penicillium arizonense]